MSEALMTLAEAHADLGCSLRTLYRLIAAGDLPVVHVSARIRKIRQAALEDFKRRKEQWASGYIKTRKDAPATGLRSGGMDDDWLMNAYPQAQARNVRNSITLASSASGLSENVLVFKKSR